MPMKVYTLDAAELATIHAKYGKPGESAPGKQAIRRSGPGHPTAEQVKRGGDSGRATQKQQREAAQNK